MTHGEYTTRDDCRLCGGAHRPVLELQPTPLANEFVVAPSGHQETFPLSLVRCNDCGHVQLSSVVDPRRLFANYVYESGTSTVFVEHFRRYAESMVHAHGLLTGDLVVEIGSNDGTMLRAFGKHGLDVLGIDPAVAIAERATISGVPTLARFFDANIVAEIRRVRGHAILVVANNVFAHADNLRAIAEAVSYLIDPDQGRFVFEVQYLVDMVEGCLFDMVYHEHLSYHSLGPLVPFFRSMGMSVVDCEHVPTHGGSIRVTVANGERKSSERVAAMAQHEMSVLTDAAFRALRERIDAARGRMREFLNAEVGAGRTVAGYGAPAKLTTLCHEFGITVRDLAFIVDDSPLKQGLFTPGTHIPVMSMATAPTPDTFIIFAWNFGAPIAAKLRAGGFRGKIVAPLPEFMEFA